jgi:hypothetical protein
MSKKNYFNFFIGRNHCLAFKDLDQNVYHTNFQVDIQVLSIETHFAGECKHYIFLML